MNNLEKLIFLIEENKVNYKLSFSLNYYIFEIYLEDNTASTLDLLIYEKEHLLVIQDSRKTYSFYEPEYITRLNKIIYQTYLINEEYQLIDTLYQKTLFDKNLPNLDRKIQHKL